MFAAALPQSSAGLSRAAALRGTLLAVALLVWLSGRLASGAEALRIEPLAPRSAPRGATLFATLRPEQTGVVTENRYADPRMWGDLFAEFTLGAIGTGVAAGDYDGDGRPDLFVVSKTERCRLFRNLGGWRFEDVSDRAGLAATEGEVWKQGAAFADVNNDGWLDLYLCRFDAPNQLWINQGDGTFREEAATRGLAIRDASGMAAFCDYDRDGWLDVFVQTNVLSVSRAPGGQPDHLLRNRGDGTFADVTAAAGIAGEAFGHSAVWWDHDDDGWPDLYVANDFSKPDRLYRNRGDGTFADVLAQAVPHLSFHSMGTDLGDVDNDGRLDLFVSEMIPTSYEKDLRTMAESRAQLDQAPPAPAGTPPQVMRNTLLLNTGTGRMQEAALLAGLGASDWTWAVRWEDFDNDGRLDLFAANGMVRELHNVDLLGRIRGAETTAERVRLMRSSPTLAEANLAFRNLGDLQFAPAGAAWGLDRKGVSFGAATADFDGDGDLDLVHSNYQDGVTLLRNDSDTGHRLVVVLRGARSNRWGVGATVRIETAAGAQVRQLVLARGYCSTSEPVLHFGLGDEETVARMTVTWPSGAVQTFAGLPVDRRLTVTEPAETPRRDEPAARPAPTLFAPVEVALGRVRENGAEEPVQPALLPWRLNRRGPALAVGEVNGDDREDLVLGGTPLDPASVRPGRPAGGGAAEAAAWPRSETAVNDGPVLVFDADGDGRNDVLVTRGGVTAPAGSAGYAPILYLNRGDAGWAASGPEALPAVRGPVGAAVAADFDRDGQLDLFLGGRSVPRRYPLAAPSALLANRGGRFEDVTDRLAPGLREAGPVQSALWSDVDRDGWVDLLTASEWGGVRYWHNRAGTGFDERSAAAGFSAAGTGWWTSLAAADFNGDGRMDYAVGNLGLNTPYRASTEDPALLFYGAFKDGGVPMILEASGEGGVLRPRRTRSALSLLVPMLAKKFPRTEAYARATLPELVGEERLAAARRFAVTEARSGVFLSQPDGTVRFSPLPRIAQVAPIQGLAAGDFDGDGRADLYAVQNSFAPWPSMGRFDGGLSQLLLGDGRGGFRAVPPAESGLVVPGDAKALVVADFDGDGWSDFIVTRNDEVALAFRHAAAAPRPWRLRLQGGAGNPTAIGARVTVEWADGRTQLGEVSAGGGWMSQSSPVLAFGRGDSAVPVRVEVRWPRGARTVHTGPFEPNEQTLTAP